MPKSIRPGDLLRPPEKPKSEKDSSDKEIPLTWKNAVDEAGEWPFVDPDVMLEEEVDSFNEFPDDDDEIPREITPFSEYEPWGKMDEETDRDYELFSHYRASGLGRTYAATAKHFEISQPYVSKRAQVHDWPDRVKSWDDYRERIYTSTVIERTKKMAENHAGIAAKGIQALAMVFDEILERGKDRELLELEFQSMSTRALFQLADKAARALPNLMNAERISRGLPTELTAEVQVKENRVTIQTTEELNEIVTGLYEVLERSTGEEENDEGEIVDIEEVLEEE